MSSRGDVSMLIDEHTALTLRDICRVCDVRSETVIAMVEEGVLYPQGAMPDEWRFSASAVIRAHRALRLTRDLRVNWPGAALALELLDELEALRRERRFRLCR